MQLLKKNIHTLHKRFSLDLEDMNIIYNGWISDEKKMRHFADSDCQNRRDIIRDVISGMIGELGAYYYLKSCNIQCCKPNYEVLDRNKNIWDRDLFALENVRIISGKNKIITVDRSITCKAQFLSQTKNIGDTEPSWTFQKSIPNRHGDPILENPVCNKLLVVSWIDNLLNDGNEVCYTNPKVAYKKGFRYILGTSCFWWPEVFNYQHFPRKKSLRHKKKCLYYKDIKHLECRIAGDYNV